MGLASGSTLGVYLIRDQIGAGGMGEVYRATDPRLGRDVALKILPASHAADPERLRRFELEARAASSLNHPSVLQVFDIGSEDGVHYMIEELLKGETLAQRLKAGALPLRRAVGLSIQIAQGLAVAHDNGIVHRDIKPENLFVTSDGRAKILDFGIAKLVATELAFVNEDDRTSSMPWQTGPGRLIGSVGYMAPEQVRGQEVDHRADIFAFGAVAYEMLTGERAFHAGTAAETLTAILQAEPEERRGREGDLPPALWSILHRCLAKRTEERFRSTHDLAFALGEVDRHASVNAGRPPVRTDGARGPHPAYVAGGILVLFASGLLLGRSTRSADPRETVARETVQLDISLPHGVRIAWEDGAPVLAVSADGRRVAFTGASSDRPRLFVRDLGDEEAQPIPGTENAVNPFFSPDGRWLGFLSGGKLHKVPVDGSSQAVTLTDAGRANGADWGMDDTIVLGQGAGGLWRVSADGVDPEILARPEPGSDDRSFRWPQFLPDGDQVLFTTVRDGAPDRLEILSLSDRSRRELALAYAGATRWLAPGYLVRPDWGTKPMQGTLTAVRAGADQAPVGPSVTFSPRIHAGGYPPGGLFDLADDGTLVYVPWRLWEGRFVRVGRDGHSQPLTGLDPSIPLAVPRFSPDGRRLAYGAGSGEAEHSVWILDLARGSRRRLAQHGAGLPLWSPDGRQVIFRSSRDGAANVYRVPADGSGMVEAVTSTSPAKIPTSISPDGRWVLFSQNDPDTLYDLWRAPLDRRGEPRPLLVESGSQTAAAYSPDGRWIAYVSDESGFREVYVRASDGSGGKSLVSTAGGVEPAWSPDNRHLFYRRGRELLSVPVSFEAEPRFGVPALVFAGEYAAHPRSTATAYDVDPDGQSFVMVEPSAESQPRMIRVMLGFREEVERRLNEADEAAR